MDRTQRARALLDVVALLSQAQAALDALAVGDTSTMPSELKHTLDAPKEAIRAYARAMYLGASSSSTMEHTDTGETIRATGDTGASSPGVCVGCGASADGAPCSMCGAALCDTYTCLHRHIRACHGDVSIASPKTSWRTSGELADIERRRKLDEEEAHRRAQRLLDD